MKMKELYDMIKSLADYIIVAYGEAEIRVSSVEQALNEKIFDGLYLNEISDEILI